MPSRAKLATVRYATDKKKKTTLNKVTKKTTTFIVFNSFENPSKTIFVII